MRLWPILLLLPFLCPLATAQSVLRFPGMENHWVGNTFGSKEEHIQNFVEGAVVDPDGSVWTTSFWDEGGAQFAVYKDGRRINRAFARKIRSDSVYHPLRGSWVIRNFYGRAFLGKIAPPPTGDSAPWIEGPAGASIRSLVDPTALGVLPDGRLMVADNGPDQNVKIFDVTDPAHPVLTEQFGDSGGVFSGPRPGADGPLRFWGIRGIGADSLGHVCVASTGLPMQVGGGTDIRCFEGLGVHPRLLWQVQGQSFVNSADFDPDSAGQSIFLNAERFHMDWSRPAGRSARFAAATIDPFRFPRDPRLVQSLESVFVRRFKDHLYLYLVDMYTRYLAVVRFEPNSEIAIPCAYLPLSWNGLGDIWAGKEHPTWDSTNEENFRRRWLWVDRNGDGAPQPNEFETFLLGYPFVSAIDVTTNGGILLGGRVLTYLPPPTTDAVGVPLYAAADVKIWQVPFKENSSEVARLRYLEPQDVLLLAAGSKSSNGYSPDKVFRYDAWSTKPVESRYNIPYADAGQGVPIHLDENTAKLVIPWSFTADADYAYVAYLDRGPHAKLRGEVTVLDAKTGAVAGYLTPGLETNFFSGAIDLRHAVNVAVGPNGERFVSVEEDGAGKVMIYRFCPKGAACQSSKAPAPRAAVDLWSQPGGFRLATKSEGSWTRARLVHLDGLEARTWKLGPGTFQSTRGLPSGPYRVLLDGLGGISTTSVPLFVLP